MDNVTNAKEFKVAEDALQCPFCGNKVIYTYEYDTVVGKRYGILCAECMTNKDTGYWQHRQHAVTAWNKRV